MSYVWDFQTIFASWPLLSQGLLNTLKPGLLTLITGLFFGLFVGLGRYSRNRWVNFPASVFVEVFRNTPALVQIMWFYFAFPIISPFDIDAFSAAALGLGLNTTAFCAEIFRGGIQSIHRGQWEAGKALGMTYQEQVLRVILPQAVVRMIPAFMNRVVELMKMTSLASVIAFGELMHQAKTISTYHFNPIESYTVVALLFFVVISPFAFLVYRLENRFRK